ncbi:MAG TPA: NYN domain-containing protein [Nocardioidaceae bacterium]|nr:NYN domain-containing protein [Nocardioidaceae bacterium]
MTEPGGGQDPGDGPPLLPEPVRLRALALAADALGQVPAEQLPAPLRRVASFAPARRARLAATPIASALETDEAFRDRVATQVRVAVPQLAAALDEGAPPPAANPVEVAAVAYLLRSEGWKDHVEAARDANQSAAEPADRTSGTVERLQQKLRDARAQMRAAQAKARDQVAEVKRENAELRRKLGDARQRLSAAEQAAQAAALAQESAQKDSAALESEARRLRARVTELEASSSAARRSVRDERESATLRARLLLDAVLESAQGLRRELALPPVSGKPADAVAEAVEGAAAQQSSTARAAGMALAPDDPALLDELFALPRVHVVIDGYNVTKTAWSSAPLDSQRNRLLNGLAPLVARNRAEVTVVFDGAELKDRPPVAGPRGVRVMFSPLGVIADDVIRDLLEVEPPGRPVVVVSSDREVATAAYRSGARAVEAAALVRLLGRT